ncbi:MAG TPA: GNAT family N-acetyltransferase [Pyrinomonadaceae bacterium]|nr:GNAT family N-acetyltransferase [Pyrinomonadaceae bacterium]
MNTTTAQAIADLINDHNHLTINYSAKKVLAAAENYLCRLDDESRLIGVVEIKKVQWYQCEILHLSVRADAEGRGIGSWLLCEAETRVVALGRRVAQCTIRVGNKESEGLFRKFDYLPTVTFLNQESGNQVTVYQKALVT